MTISIILALLFGFFIESVFGFGGTVLSLAILGFILDIKTLVSLMLYVASVASLSVIITDRKSFSRKDYLDMIIVAIPGAIVGAFLFSVLSSAILLKILAVFLILMAVHSFLEPRFHPHAKKLMLFLAGVMHGVFGLGGVMSVGTMKNEFKHKSQLRITFAAFFITLNIIRAIQYYVQGVLDYTEILRFWWIPFPLIFVIWLGHKVHLKISEKHFKKGVSLLLLFAGIFFLLS